MAPHKFVVPKDGLTYTKLIIARCEDLIASDIWEDLDATTLRRWIANFTSDEELYFAACVLDALVYRSRKQTIALIQHLFTRVLPDLTRLHTTPLGRIERWLERLGSPVDPGIRLVTAVRQTDPPTKSAHVIARYMKREFGVSESWIIKAWDVNAAHASGIRVFVFVDDFLGTGDQFERFFNREGLDRITGWYPIYAPLIAHEEGLRSLRTFGELHVAAVEILSSAHSLFDPASKAFQDGVNSSAAAFDFYCELLSAKNILLDDKNRLGYGGLGLSFAFQHAAPDNSLPILWWQDSREWHRLFPR